MLLRVLLLIAIVLAIYRYWQSVGRRRQQYFLYDYRFPEAVARSLSARYPQLSGEDWAQVAQGLRQYFRMQQRSAGQALLLPSRVVADYWQVLAEHPQAYHEYCQHTLGAYRPPQTAELAQPASAYLATWQAACADEGLRAAQQQPLLFTLDQRLGLPGARVFQPQDFPA
ncbi:hypothetical protein [Chitinibacter tainanensis]|uniref:hypothetical protein n=1 Tax=Chitinibacter tainanensis TaxID=230667 RepID=UPI002356F2EF|nr:hypothetical protein [Chitinibacter tainanensis]